MIMDDAAARDSACREADRYREALVDLLAQIPAEPSDPRLRYIEAQISLPSRAAAAVLVEERSTP